MYLAAANTLPPSLEEATQLQLFGAGGGEGGEGGGDPQVPPPMPLPRGLGGGGCARLGGGWGGWAGTRTCPTAGGCVL